MSRRPRRSSGFLAAAAATAVLLTGCGAGSSPAESAPEIAERLEQVDAAVVAGKDAVARDAVRALVLETEEALAAGDIEQAQAEVILAAADELLTQLGGVADRPGEPVEPTEEPTEEPSAEPEEEPEKEPEPKPGKPDEDDKPDKPGKGHGKAHGHDDDDEDD